MTELNKSHKYYLQLSVTWSICGCALKCMNRSWNKHLLSNSQSLTCLLSGNKQPDRTTAIMCGQRNVRAVLFPWSTKVTPHPVCGWCSIPHRLQVSNTSFTLGNDSGSCVLHQASWIEANTTAKPAPHPRVADIRGHKQRDNFTEHITTHPSGGCSLCNKDAVTQIAANRDGCWKSSCKIQLFLEERDKQQQFHARNVANYLNQGLFLLTHFLFLGKRLPSLPKTSVLLFWWFVGFFFWSICHIP